MKRIILLILLLFMYGSAYSQYTGGSGDGYSAGRTIIGDILTKESHFFVSLSVFCNDFDPTTENGRATFPIPDAEVKVYKKNANSWSVFASGKTNSSGIYSLMVNTANDEYYISAAAQGFATAQSVSFVSELGKSMDLVLAPQRSKPQGHIVTKIFNPDSTLTDAKFSITFIPVSGQNINTSGTGKIINARLPLGKYKFVAVLTDERYIFPGTEAPDTLTGTIDLTTEDQTVYLLPTVEKK